MNMILTAAIVFSMHSITGTVLQVPKVDAVRCFEYHNTVVVCVLTEPIYLLSERTALKQDIEKLVLKEYGINAVVSFDALVYSKISDAMTDKEKLSVFKKLGIT